MMDEIAIRDEKGEQIRQLTNALTERLEFPPSFKLTRSRAIILSLLMKRESVSYETIMQALYSGKPAGQGSQNVVQVHVSLLRKMIQQFGARIDNYRYDGGGYYMDKESKARLRAAIDAAK